MIKITGIVHVAENMSGGIWYHIFENYGVAVAASPFESIETVKQKMQTSGVISDFATHKAIMSSFTKTNNRSLVVDFIKKVRGST